MKRLFILAIWGILAVGIQQANGWQDGQPFPANIRGIAAPNQRLDLKPQPTSPSITSPRQAEAQLNPSIFSEPVYIVGRDESPIPFTGNPTNVYRKPTQPRLNQPMTLEPPQSERPNKITAPSARPSLDESLLLPVAIDDDRPEPPPKIELDQAIELPVDLGTDLDSSANPIGLGIENPALESDSTAVAMNLADELRVRIDQPAGFGQTFQDDSNLNQPEDTPSPEPSMKVQLLAPEWLEASRSTALQIEVLNLSQAASKPATVELKVPAEFTITELDRNAMLDEAKRTIRFQVDAIPAGYKQTISLRGVSLVAGRHELEVALSNASGQLDARKLALGVLETSGTIRNAKQSASPKR